MPAAPPSMARAVFADRRLLWTVFAGSLVLGQNQECFGGCFSPEQSLAGDMANVRIWDRALPQVQYELWV